MRTPSCLQLTLLSLVLLLLSPFAIAQPTNDICSSAIDVQDYVNGSSMASMAGPFTNELATGNDLDIQTVTGCWFDDLGGNADGSSPQIDATVWFLFQGSEGPLSIESLACDSNLNFLSQDTQMILFKGECDSLAVVACNEDINSATFNYWSGINTYLQEDATYYLAVDGFNYSGFGSPEMPLTTGEFCLQFTIPTAEIHESEPVAVAVYPNPTNDRVYVQSTTHIRQIEIWNVSGVMVRQIATPSVTRYEMQMEEATGVYFMRVRTDGGVTQHTLVKL
jgi:hypothetical protein